MVSFTFVILLHRAMRAHLPARVAARALVQVYYVPRVGSHRDGINGAMLGADGAAGAVLLHAVLDEGCALAGRAPALQMRLILVAEIPQRGQHRIRRGLAEAAQTALSDLGGQLLEFLKMPAAGFAGAEEIEQFEHPLRADATEGAFAAGQIGRAHV